MLTPYNQNILKRELQKTGYDGKTQQQGWEWLMLPGEIIREEPTNALLTPFFTAGVLGPIKANAIASKAKQMLPFIADSLMVQGVRLDDPMTQDFLKEMVDGTSITEEDVNKLIARATRTVSLGIGRMFDKRFYPSIWPHVDDNGNEGSPSDKAIHGFPNDITREDFNLSWQNAGRL